MRAVINKTELNELWSIWRTGNFVREIGGVANANNAIFKLLENTERLEGNLRCQGIHTCHKDCQNMVCLLHRENEKLKKKIFKLTKGVSPTTKSKEKRIA